MATAWEAPRIEWDELKVARMTYPELPSDAQGTWLGLERVKYKPPLLQGYFTFRVVTNKFGPSLLGHIELGRSHVLASMTIDATVGGKREPKIIQLFLVDLRKAVMRLDLARRKCNTHGEEYYQFDSMTPGVDLFAERLRIQ